MQKGCVQKRQNNLTCFFCCVIFYTSLTWIDLLYPFYFNVLPCPVLFSSIPDFTLKAEDSATQVFVCFPLNMVVKNTNQLEEPTNSTYDRKTEVKAFDDSKAGVKGLVESGVSKIPRIFHTGKLDMGENSTSDSKLSIPIIDFKDIHINQARRVEVIDQIQSACHVWGFFQVINHDIPIDVLDEMIHGIRSFHEQDGDVRKEFYTRDLKKKVMYFSNGTLFSGQAVNWRDTLGFSVAPRPIKPNELPSICR